MKTMLQIWEEYASQVYPTVPQISVQYVELKQAFYSGAFAFINWTTDFEEGDEPTEADLNAMDLMHAEIQSFLLSRTMRQHQ